MTLSILVLLAGVVAFYWFDEDSLPLRLGMVAGGLVVAGAIALDQLVRARIPPVCPAARVELRKWSGRAARTRSRTTIMVSRSPS